ncbi:MAG: T9SS type A sorting domain-containing protein [Cytophagaceae bacterium]|nr:T9SS type A sorting domain-containing protein [Cytophagaceae bacterium]
MLSLPVLALGNNAYHVKVSGSSSGNGSKTNPWNLQTALNHPQKVAAGDTIWVHGGVYHGAFVSKLWGSANNPIIVRAVPGEQVILDGNGYNGDGVLSFEGRYTWIWGLTITTSNTNRNDDKDVVFFIGSNNKLINCTVSNGGGNGVGLWKTAIDSEIYGCIIYHNGYIGDTRGHGHGVYIQNETGTKLVRNNVIFNSYGVGIHVFGETAHIRGYNIEENTMFNCGLPYGMLERHILIGGNQPVERAHVKSNLFYNRQNISSKAMMQFGYSYGTTNKSAEFTGNYMVDGSYYCIAHWDSMRVTENTIISHSENMQLIAFDPTYFNIGHPYFNYNTYHKGNLGLLSFNEWQNVTGEDANSTYSADEPTATCYFVNKNIYEEGRANITVYNWAGSNSVNVDVSNVLNTGDEYELFDTSNLAVGAIASGTFNGNSISVPMQLTEVELPNGVTNGGTLYVHTAPHFGAFVLRRTKENAGTSSVERKTLSGLTVYPNPVNESVTVTFQSETAGKITLEVTDSAGRIVFSETVGSCLGQNSYTHNISFLQAGLYIIAVNDSKNLLNAKLIVARK